VGLVLTLRGQRAKSRRHAGYTFVEIAIVTAIVGILASAALPLLFPAVRIGSSWYGDGGVRLLAPLAPAIHLGANRILAVSTRYRRSIDEADRPVVHGYPPPAQVIGTVLNAVFLDQVEQDAQGLKRINRLLAKALGRLAPPELVLNEIPIKDLPLYSPDFDADYPPVARALKQSIADVDAVLFVTPEYNRSIPGGLKNAIDWASRPWGKNSFARKPTGVIGTSPGPIGTAVAQQSLRGVLCYCNSPLLNQVEAYIQFKPGLITADGEVTNEATQEFLRNYMTELHAFVARVLTVLPRNA